MSDVIDVIIPARDASKTIAGVVRPFVDHPAIGDIFVIEIGRASCRERV